MKPNRLYSARAIGDALAPRIILTSGPTIGFPFGRASPGGRASGDFEMPTKIREIPKETIDAFACMVDIDVESGSVTWKHKKANRKAGAEVGNITDKGYRRTSFNGHYFYVHRFLWNYAHGSIPDGYEIDHIDGNKTNNSLRNMRLVTCAQNRQNLQKDTCRTSGIIGATWNSRKSKWKSQIGLNKKSLFIGYFDTKEAAHEAYVQAKRTYHPFGTL